MTLFEHELAAIVAEIAEIDMDLISLDATLKEIGVDSLMSVEIAVWVEQRWGVHFSEDDLNAMLCFRDLVQLTEQKLQPVEVV